MIIERIAEERARSIRPACGRAPNALWRPGSASPVIRKAKIAGRYSLCRRSESWKSGDIVAAQCTESFKVSFERGSTAKPLMIKLVLAATAFSLAETALLLLSLQERMFEIKGGRRTTIIWFEFVKATPH